MFVRVSLKNNVMRLNYKYYHWRCCIRWILNPIFLTDSLNVLNMCCDCWHVVLLSVCWEWHRWRVTVQHSVCIIKGFQFSTSIFYTFHGEILLRFAFINHWEKSLCCDQISQQQKWLSFSFTGSVKLKGIIISGEDDDSHPAEIRLWVAHLSDPVVCFMLQIWGSTK